MLAERKPGDIPKIIGLIGPVFKTAAKHTATKTVLMKPVPPPSVSAWSTRLPTPPAPKNGVKLENATAIQPTQKYAMVSIAKPVAKRVIAPTKSIEKSVAKSKCNAQGWTKVESTKPQKSTSTKPPKMSTSNPFEALQAQKINTTSSASVILTTKNKRNKQRKNNSINNP